MIAPIKPLNKADVAEAIGCSIRNIEKLVNAGTLPKPAHIGGLVLWHPEIFYTWLDKVLRNTEQNESQFTEQNAESSGSQPFKTKLAAPKSRSSDAVRRMQARQAARMSFA